MTSPRRTTRLFALSALTALSVVAANLAPALASPAPVQPTWVSAPVAAPLALAATAPITSRPAPRLSIGPGLRAELSLHLAGPALNPAPPAPVVAPVQAATVQAPVPKPARKTTATPKASKPAVRAKTTAKTTTQRTTTQRTTTQRTTTSYRGRNHVWIPSLGINKSVAAFPCSRTRPPDNLVYRWGCAGKNNVYLLGHAYSVFKPLHDAYVSGRLKKGMVVVYGDGAGKIHTYKVSWWKLTLPTTDASWAWAPQSRPSMTLQTCIGKNNKYRLMVRLLES
jgi:hypothetical protein